MSNITENIDENINKIKKAKLTTEERITLLANLKTEVEKNKKQLTDEEKKARNRLNVSIHYYRHREEILAKKKIEYQIKKNKVD